jgi:hypothetical protein
VAAGAACWAARDAGEIGSVGPLSSAEGKSRGELAAFAPTQARREFRSMAVAADETPKCAPPKPPKDPKVGECRRYGDGHRWPWPLEVNRILCLSAMDDIIRYIYIYG